jgi:hypothetical protein
MTRVRGRLRLSSPAKSAIVRCLPTGPHDWLRGRYPADPWPLSGRGLGAADPRRLWRVACLVSAVSAVKPASAGRSEGPRDCWDCDSVWGQGAVGDLGALGAVGFLGAVGAGGMSRFSAPLALAGCAVLGAAGADGLSGRSMLSLLSV